MKISVVIPTYNRGIRLAPTLDALLSNEVPGVAEVEIIVVDDGSPAPAKPVVESRRVAPPFSLRCVRQTNAGPAAARNAGFRAARGEIVLFVDDDIIAPPDLIHKHIKAHDTRPGSVIFGRWQFVEPEPVTPLFQYVNSLGYDSGEGTHEEFLEVGILASGQISVERSMFDAERGVYRSDLATPAAEEFELSLRLRERGIPILLATRIVALHDHPIIIESLCRQQYKHAVGCAEVVAKYPATLSLSDLARVIDTNLGQRSGEPVVAILKRSCKRALAAKPARAALLGMVKIAERALPRSGLLMPLYHAVIGLHFMAGVREGAALYSRSGEGASC